MPIRIDELPKPLGVYMEVSFLDREGKKCIYIVNYRAAGASSELSFDVQTLYTEDPGLDDFSEPIIITARSLEKYNIKIAADYVELGDPYSEAKQAVLKLLAEADADRTLSRSPRKILDRLRSI